MLEQLNKEERLRLVRFVCSFAWADLSLKSEERDYVSRLVARLQLSQEEQAQVQTWLDTPPDPEDVDPNLIPLEHREMFLDAIRGLISSDLDIAPEEKEAMQLLQQLLV